jgi:hypothetical protein
VAFLPSLRAKARSSLFEEKQGTNSPAIAGLLVTTTWPFEMVSWRIVGSWGKSRGWLSLAHFPGFSSWIGPWVEEGDE